MYGYIILGKYILIFFDSCYVCCDIQLKVSKTISLYLFPSTHLRCCLSMSLLNTHHPSSSSLEIETVRAKLTPLFFNRFFCSPLEQQVFMPSLLF
jgi:hypothetical protein